MTEHNAYPMKHWREVARVYNSCTDSKPTIRVAEHFGMPLPTANYHVRQARKHGFLPPVEQIGRGTHGGYPSDRLAKALRVKPDRLREALDDLGLVVKVK